MLCLTCFVYLKTPAGSCGKKLTLFIHVRIPTVGNDVNMFMEYRCLWMFAVVCWSVAPPSTNHQVSGGVLVASSHVFANTNEIPKDKRPELKDKLVTN